MKKLNLSGVITSIRAKVDGSLGISLNTPELSPDEKVEFFNLQNQNISIKIEPMDYVNAPELEVNKDIETKTPSQRQRNALYVLWQSRGSQGYFDDYYRNQMEKIIESIKGKIE